jgi:RNase H-like domain found in reverse transcriptase
MDTQRHYHVFEHEMIAILEALLKWEEKLLGYHVHMVTDHKVLEFFKMQCKLLSQQTQWMEYLSRFDFDI